MTTNLSLRLAADIAPIEAALNEILDLALIESGKVLFRCRNVIEQAKLNHQIIAEVMLLWGWPE